MSFAIGVSILYMYYGLSKTRGKSGQKDIEVEVSEQPETCDTDQLTDRTEKGVSDVGRFNAVFNSHGTRTLTGRYHSALSRIKGSPVTTATSRKPFDWHPPNHRLHRIAPRLRNHFAKQLFDLRSHSTPWPRTIFRDQRWTHPRHPRL